MDGRLYLIIRTMDDGGEASRHEVSDPTIGKVQTMVSGLLRTIDPDWYYVDATAFDHLTD